MAILLTGGAGYIGSHTCVELIRRGFETVMADNLVNSDKSVLDRIGRITGVRPAFYQCDVADKKAEIQRAGEDGEEAEDDFFQIQGESPVNESYFLP